jgi:hypothetical protein
MRAAALAALVLAAAASGCIKTSSCNDGLTNGHETGSDCGGPDCPSCVDGLSCILPRDCFSKSCIAGVCSGPGSLEMFCSDGIFDGEETDIDCGGGCTPCFDGFHCQMNSDCLSKKCGLVGVCDPTSCTDGVQNGNEEGVDCGGECPVCVAHQRGADAPFPPPTTPVYKLQVGAANPVAPMVRVGFGLSVLSVPQGDRFKVVWTGDGATPGILHELWGSIYSPGAFSDVLVGCENDACPIESNDLVSAVYLVSGGERIDFDTMCADELDGIEFSVNAEPVYFDLWADGARQPMQVWFTAAPSGMLANAGEIPFGAAIN